MARACLPDDRDGAVREVAQVYELIKTHQPLLLHHHQGQQDPPATTQLLLSEALRALNIALSAMTVMQQQQQKESSSTTASPQLLSPSPASEPAAADSKGATTGTSARSGKRRRPAMEGGKNSSSWVNFTTFPYEDVYEWRKYGEKRINGTQFTRSYFRCTYKYDTGCLATKYVQQKDNSDPPMFQVTYNNEHTCNCTTTSLPAKKNNNFPTGGAASNNPPIGGHHDVMIVKQEATVLLHPPADVSAVPLDDQMSCQEPFPIADPELQLDHYVTTGGGHSSYISGVL